jgi:hypothetical protein
MKRSELEHILWASRSLTGQTEFIVIGSQSMKGDRKQVPRTRDENSDMEDQELRRPNLRSL